MSISIHVRRTGLTTIALALASAVSVAPAQAKKSSTYDSTPPAVSVFQAAGPNAASIQSNVDAYRAALGILNPNNPGSVGSGRREINWDAVPEPVSSPNAFPGDFFNGPAAPRARGVVFATNGTGFQVSANEGTIPVRFGNLNASYPTLFSVFSPQKLFTPIGSRLTKVTFAVPGSAAPAGVSGFGAVFTDVDRSRSTRMALYDANNRLLWIDEVPASPGQGSVSFLGAKLDCSNCVAKVKIISGNVPVGADEVRRRDIVAMDDFIFGEPIAR